MSERESALRLRADLRQARAALEAAPTLAGSAASAEAGVGR